jgi:hypothetical protein
LQHHRLVMLRVPALLESASLEIKPQSQLLREDGGFEADFSNLVGLQSLRDLVPSSAVQPRSCISSKLASDADAEAPGPLCEGGFGDLGGKRDPGSDFTKSARL